MTKVRISKWGDSSAICLPQAVMDDLGAVDGQEIDVSVEDGKVVLSPVTRKTAPTLEWIVAEMKRLGPENEPEMVDWGPDVGDEIIVDDYSRGSKE
jgi:antitoxin MazE